MCVIIINGIEAKDAPKQKWVKIQNILAVFYHREISYR